MKALLTRLAALVPGVPLEEHGTCPECGATQFMHELTCPTLTQSPVRHDAATTASAYR